MTLLFMGVLKMLPRSLVKVLSGIRRQVMLWLSRCDSCRVMLVGAMALGLLRLNMVFLMLGCAVVVMMSLVSA